jgi:hypothetical protein
MIIRIGRGMNIEPHAIRAPAHVRSDFRLSLILSLLDWLQRWVSCRQSAILVATPLVELTMASASPAVLQAIFADDFMRQRYADFCKSEHNEENVAVLQDIQAFTAARDPATKLLHAQAVYALLRSGTVNASSKVKAGVSSAITKLRLLETTSPEAAEELHALHESLATLEHVVVRELVGDSLPRFLSSPAYKEALTKGEIAPRTASLLRGSAAPSTRFLRVSNDAASVAATAGAPGSHTDTPIGVLAMESPSDRTTTLLNLLAHPGTRACFVDFCRYQHNQENVELLIAINEFRCPMDAATRKEKASHILETYIRAGSEYEANIDGRTRMFAEVFLTSSMSKGTLATLEEAGGSDALSKVETELINMLSGEVLPRFAVSKVWLEFQASLAPKTDVGEAGSTHGAKSSGGWFRKLGKNKEPEASEPHGGKLHDPVASLRDKFYVFGVSLKPSLFSLGSAKRAELELYGAEIKASALRSGFILKRAHHKSSWKRRWFVLTPHVLAYFDSPAAPQPSGVLLLSEITGVSLDPPTDEISKSKRFLFKPGKPDAPESLETDVPSDVQSMAYLFYVYTPHRPYILQGSSDKERSRWMVAIDAAHQGKLEKVKDMHEPSVAQSTLSDSLHFGILHPSPLPHFQVGVPIGCNVASADTPLDAAIALEVPISGTGTNSRGSYASTNSGVAPQDEAWSDAEEAEQFG